MEATDEFGNGISGFHLNFKNQLHEVSVSIKVGGYHDYLRIRMLFGLAVSRLVFFPFRLIPLCFTRLFKFSS